MFSNECTYTLIWYTAFSLSFFHLLIWSFTLMHTDSARTMCYESRLWNVLFPCPVRVYLLLWALGWLAQAYLPCLTCAPSLPEYQADQQTHSQDIQALTEKNSLQLTESLQVFTRVYMFVWTVSCHKPVVFGSVTCKKLLRACSFHLRALSRCFVPKQKLKPSSGWLRDSRL